jgi:hypothetical protein
MRESTGSNRFWIWLYSFVGLIMTIAVCVFTWVSIQSREQNTTGTASGPVQHPTREIPAERYQLLAKFELPEYVDRGAKESQAMQRYVAHDYAGAVAALRGIDTIDARFYLGICLLVTGKNAEGVSELRRVVAIGDSPYLERAHFYLVKGLLATGDTAGARTELKKVIAMHGELEKQAKALLSAVG